MADYVTRDELEATETRLSERIDALDLSVTERIDALGLRVTERIDASEIRLLERIEKSETTLLREFHKWAQIAEMRLRTNEFSVSGLTERMAMLETRMSDLKRR